MSTIAALTVNSRNDHGFQPPPTWREAMAAVYEGENLRGDEARALLETALAIADAKLAERIPADLAQYVPTFSPLRPAIFEMFNRNASTASEVAGLKSLFETIGACADL